MAASAIMGLVFLALNCGPRQQGQQERWDVSDENRRQLPSIELNSLIEQGVVAGEQWPFSPIPLACRVLNACEDAAIVRTRLELHDRTETEQATVVVIRDDLPDDSVRGDWHRVELSRNEAGSWTIDVAYQAFRCRRSTDTGYTPDPCP